MPDNLISESDYKNSSIDIQESLFSLSCLSRSQRWAGSVEWSDDEWQKHVIDHGVKLVDDISDDRLSHIARKLGLSNNEKIVEEQLLEGDRFTCKFLKWYLEDNISSLSCESESNNNRSEPDLTLYHRGITRAKLELKRIVNSGNIDEYVDGFIGKNWHEHDPNQPSVLLLYFPTLKTEEWRVRTFVQGYQGFIQQLDDWEDNWMYVRTIPAPINAETEFRPLETTEKFVKEIDSIDQS